MRNFARPMLALFMALALCLTLVSAAPGLAEGASTSLFGYVIDMGGNTVEIMTDDERPFTFTRDDATSVVPDGEVNIDDAIMLRYSGTLNQNAQQQSVKVLEIDVMTVLYGTVTDATMNTITVLNDEDGRNYTFGIEDADIVKEGDSILLNDQVELAFSGQLGAPEAGTAIMPTHLHITVYGQAEDDYE